ncbi:hypothetical protein C8R46DRAFT_285857 [Mycena filopes]|nr:hypothetical protein C8R46DRAFT_285857 [Mycena filopes]
MPNSSVPELEALVDSFSADIQRQKEVLKQLQRSKSLVQRQLNALRDPVTRLPLEISSEIFLQCLPAQPQPSARACPMLLLTVCHSWTDIAPRLWSSIYLDFPGVQVLQSWLERARNHALTISLSRGLTGSTGLVLARYAGQLKHLEIYDDYVKLESLLTFAPGAFSRVETLKIGCLPNEDGQLNDSNLTQILGLLKCFAPTLVECSFHNLSYLDYTTLKVLVLPNLRYLKFGEPADLRALDSLGIISYLALPALETLFLPMFGVANHVLSAFLERSSPPLQKLVLSGNGPESDFPELARCLRLTPSLTCFELHTNVMSVAHALFTALAESPTGLLPVLRCLKVTELFSLNELPYLTILRLLSLRSTQLRCLDIRILDLRKTSLQFEPTQEIRDRFRPLVAGGMDIHIGSGVANFLSF